MRVLLILMLCLTSNLFAQVQAITESSDGTIWVGSDDQLLKVAGNKTELATGYSAKGRITALAIDAGGAIWVGTVQKLLRCTSSGCEDYTGIPPAEVLSLSPGENESLWVLTHEKLYNIQENKVTSAAIPSTQLESFAAGPGGNVWISTRSSVKNYFNGQFKDVLPAFAQALTVDDKGALWIGSGHEIIRWQNGTKETFLLPAPAANVRMRPPITSILRTKSEHLYVGTTAGLFLLKGKTFQKLSEAEVLALFEDGKGTVWVGTADGLKRITQGKSVDIPLPG